MAARPTYFELRGRGEAICLTLRDQQVDFDDYRVVDADEWTPAIVLA